MRLPPEHAIHRLVRGAERTVRQAATGAQLRRGAEKFYRELKQRGIQVRVGLEASGHTRWFEQRLGHLSKQGNTLLRYLLIEAAQAAVRCDAQWRRKFVHLAMRRQRNIAIAAMARKLAVSLYWLWRNAEQASAAPQPGSHAGQLDHHSGVS